MLLVILQFPQGVRLELPQINFLDMNENDKNTAQNRPSAPKNYFPETPSPPWYRKGLRFECQRCGRCCRGEPGYVWLSSDEIQTISQYLHISRKVFLQKYCRVVNGYISLIELPDGDCIFYGKEGCEIYSVRPTQCNTYPFWNHILQSKQTWLAEKRRCRGIGKGKLYTLNDINTVKSGV